MISNFFRGCSHMLSGFSLIFQPGLRLYMLVPVLANIALFVLLFIWAKAMFATGMDYLMGWIPDWLSFLEWAFWLIYFIAMLMLIFYAFVSTANFIGAPFYGFLAEVVEERLAGKTNDEAVNFKTFLKLIPRTLGRELRKLMYYLPRILLLLVLGLIPAINAIVAIVWIMFSGWMMAIQYIDYAADNNNYSFGELRRYLHEHRSAAWGFGLLAFGLTLIPIINIIVLPAAVCGAVHFWVFEQAQSPLRRLP